MASGIAVHCAFDRLVDVVNLVPHPQNPNKHPDEQIAILARIIRAQGWRSPIVVSNRSGFIVAGHGRSQAAALLQVQEVPVNFQDFATEADELAHLLADNRIAELADMDEKALQDAITSLRDMGGDIDLAGFSETDLGALAASICPDTHPERAGTLRRRFLWPPFSILETTNADWLARKREWMSLGIRSEVGRGEELTVSKSAQPREFYDAKNAYERANGGKEVSWEAFFAACPELKPMTSTSVFDPALCEILVSWFCPPGGTILDPFSGGSVRGVVSAKLGRHYTGVDLRAEQIEENRKQGAAILNSDEEDGTATWIVGDSKDIQTLAEGVQPHFLLSCPPYAFLERYSENPADLSTMDYPEFRSAHADIIRKAAEMLRPDSFAVWVVGEVRDKAGNYVGFVPDTIRAFEDAGLRFYNEAILVNGVGSLAMRAGRFFGPARKLAKRHQNVLVFVKGDPRKATEKIGDVEILNLEPDPAENPDSEP